MPLLKKEEKKINNNNVKANHNDNSKGRLGKLCLTIAILCFGAKIAVFEHLNRTQPDIFTPCSTLCAGQTVSLVVLIFAMWKDIFNFGKTMKLGGLLDNGNQGGCKMMGLLDNGKREQES